MDVRVVSDVVILAISSLSLLVSIIALIFIHVRHRPLTSYVPMVLTCNTYSTCIMCSLIVIEFYINNLHGDLNRDTTFARATLARNVSGEGEGARKCRFYV